MKRGEIPVNILLADDDLDGRGLFTKALGKLPIKTNLTMVHDGELLMSCHYDNSNHHPDTLFLDLAIMMVIQKRRPGKKSINNNL